MAISNYIAEFKKWFKLKILLWNKETKKVVFKQGEIWWCSVGLNLGEEIFGKGEKFTSSSFSGIPLTSKEKHGSWYTEISLQNKRSWVILKLGTLDDADLRKVKADFLKLYGSWNLVTPLARGSVGKSQIIFG